jgi:hypothetical protein
VQAPSTSAKAKRKAASDPAAAKHEPAAEARQRPNLKPKAAERSLMKVARARPNGPTLVRIRRRGTNLLDCVNVAEDHSAGELPALASMRRRLLRKSIDRKWRGLPSLLARTNETRIFVA